MSGSTPPPPAPAASGVPPGRLPFQTIFRRTAAVVANLTSLVVFVREFPPWLQALPSLGWREASVDLILRLTGQAVVLSANSFPSARIWPLVWTSSWSLNPT